MDRREGSSAPAGDRGPSEPDWERQWLLRLLDVVPDALFVVDADTRIVRYVNSAAAELLGYTRDELIGVPAEQIRPELSDGQRRARIEQMFADPTGPMPEPRMVLRSKSGELIPCETHRTPTADPDGTRYIVNAVRDVRGRLEREQRLHSTEESFRVAFEQAPIGMAILRVDELGHRVILRANQALAEILAEPLDRLVGADFAEFTLPTDESTDAEAAAGFASGRDRSYARLKCYRRRDGSLVWGELRSSVVDFPDLEGTTALAHIVDVTAREEGERQRAFRADVTALVSEITTAVLADQPQSSVHQRVVDGLARVFDADHVGLFLRDPVSGELSMVAGVGEAAALIPTGQTPADGPRVDEMLREAPLVFAHAPPLTPEWLRPLIGPAAIARLSEVSGFGVLGLSRSPGAPPFTPSAVAQLRELAGQIALVLALGRARADQQRLAVLEDRRRIARDLHDIVIQDLIAIGMQLSAAGARDPDTAGRERTAMLTAGLEEAVRRLRTAVYELGDQAPDETLTATVHTAVTAAARILGHLPELQIQGPVEDVPEYVRGDTVAVLREALSNVARHADATRTVVRLTAGPGLFTLVVRDNGQGIPADIPLGNGLTNAQHRAEVHGGGISLTAGGDGTELLWAVPLPAVRSSE